MQRLSLWNSFSQWNPFYRTPFSNDRNFCHFSFCWTRVSLNFSRVASIWGVQISGGGFGHAQECSDPPCSSSTPEQVRPQNSASPPFGCRWSVVKFTNACHCLSRRPGRFIDAAAQQIPRRSVFGAATPPPGRGLPTGASPALVWPSAPRVFFWSGGRVTQGLGPQAGPASGAQPRPLPPQPPLPPASPPQPLRALPRPRPSPAPVLARPARPAA